MRRLGAGHKPGHLGRHGGEGGPIRAIWGVSKALPRGMAEARQRGGHRTPWTGTVCAAPWAPLLRPVVGRTAGGGRGERTRSWRLKPTSCWQLRRLFSASLGYRRQGFARTQSLSGHQGGGPGVLLSGTFLGLDWAAGVQGCGGSRQLRGGTALGISGRPRQGTVAAGALPPGPWLR